MSKKAAKYPNDIFVSDENPGTEDQYYNLTKTPEETAEMGVTKKIAHYRLEKVVTVKGSAVVE